ncbi:MAG: hypothetical protein ACYSWU_10540, partial [Planctomycetota bacterium]
GILPDLIRQRHLLKNGDRQAIGRHHRKGTTLTPATLSPIIYGYKDCCPRRQIVQAVIRAEPIGSWETTG